MTERQKRSRGRPLKVGPVLHLQSLFYCHGYRSADGERLLRGRVGMGMVAHILAGHSQSTQKIQNAITT